MFGCLVGIQAQKPATQDKCYLLAVATKRSFKATKGISSKDTNIRVISKLPQKIHHVRTLYTLGYNVIAKNWFRHLQFLVRYYKALPTYLQEGILQLKADLTTANVYASRLV